MHGILALCLTLAFLTICGCATQAPKVELTAQEQAWLKAHQGRITVAYDWKFPPLSFMDRDERFSGMDADLLSSIEKSLDFRFRYRAGKVWEELLEDIRLGRADISSALVHNQKRSEYMLFTKPYISIPLGIITNRKLASYSRLEDFKDRRVAVVGGYQAEHWLRSLSLDLEVVPVANVQEGLRDVAFGVVDAMLANLAVAAYYIQEEQLPNLKVAGLTSFEYHLRFGVRKDMPVLHSILEKSLDAIPEETLNSIRDKWISIEIEGRFLDKRSLILLGVAALTLLAGMGAVTSFNRLLRREVRRKSEALEREFHERRQAQSDLQESEKHYREMFMRSPVGMFRTTPEGRLLDINPALAVNLGYDSIEHALAEISDVGRDLYADSEARPEIISQVIETGSVHIAETPFKRRDGTTFIGKIWTKPVRSPGGEITHLDGLLEDFTTASRTREALVRAKEAAEEASRSKDEFLANMSHEIRTPLNGILGLLQLLENTELTDEQRGFLTATRKTGAGLTAILGNILEFSSLENGDIDIAQQEFIPARLIGECLDTFAFQAKEQNTILESSADESIPQVMTGDEARLRQILFILVGNAVKFTPGGTVRVEAFLLPRGRSKDKAVACFSIQDTGVGIPDDRLNDVFKPFTQLDATYSKSFQGAGLGLGIVKKLLAAMGGTLALSSEEGVGTELFFTLPLGLVPDSDGPVEKSKAEASLEPAPPCTILVAEDDRVNQMSLKHFLAREGFNILTAENGSQAVEIVKTQAVDCVLMDIQMPVMSGLDATEAIRAMDGPESLVPIVALTAYAMPGDKERFLARGMDEYLSKPVDFKDLGLVVRRICRKG